MEALIATAELLCQVTRFVDKDNLLAWKKKMETIYKALSMLKSDVIPSRQTVFIDEALASARSEQIPVEEDPSVIIYIDLQLAHNEVSQKVRDSLTRLYSELQLRRSKAQI